MGATVNSRRIVQLLRVDCQRKSQGPFHLGNLGARSGRVSSGCAFVTHVVLSESVSTRHSLHPDGYSEGTWRQLCLRANPARFAPPIGRHGPDPLGRANFGVDVTCAGWQPQPEGRDFALCFSEPQLNRPFRDVGQLRGQGRRVTPIWLLDGESEPLTLSRVSIVPSLCSHG